MSGWDCFGLLAPSESEILVMLCVDYDDGSSWLSLGKLDHPVAREGVNEGICASIP